MKRSINLFSAVLCALMAANLLLAQGVAPVCHSFTAGNLTYFQDLNTLAVTGTSSSVPGGFGFAETGLSSDTTYAAGPGGTTANTFSFGSDGSADRAFGSVVTDNFTTTVGACFSNNTGRAITSIVVTYDGEMWRSGINSARLDRLNFQYSTDATTLILGTWIDVDALDFVTPITGVVSGSKDGNDADYRTPAISSTISGINVPAGATFFIRYLDLNTPGTSDDGLAVDNFTLAVLPPSAASLSLGGRILTANGQGIRNAIIKLEGGGLNEPRVALTGSFGYYKFEGLEAGQTYVLTVNSKRYTFQSRTVSLDDEIADMDFVAESALK